MSALRRSFVSSLVLLALCIVALPAQEASEVKHTEDSIETVKENLASGKALLVDVREQDEWMAGHLKLARSIPLSRLKMLAPGAELDELVKGKILYVHCRSGRRCLTATPYLKSLGFDVRPLPQGFDALVEAGLEPAEIR